MPVQVPVTVYQFSELDDRAKERARAKIREFVSTDKWWDSVYEDFQEICKIIGIDLKEHTVSTQNGKTYSRPCIWFSGFSSQGDGACFEGHYRYQSHAADNIEKYAPVDEKLQAIANELQGIEETSEGSIDCEISHKGHYTHSNSMYFEFNEFEREDGEVIELTVLEQVEVATCLRKLADWLYKTLEAEYEARTCDYAIEDMIEANDYLFHKNGKLFCKVD